jgi:hypothetical protein
VEKLQTEFYYDTAIAYYNRTLSRPLEGIYPLFWVETDDPNWDVVRQWQKKYPNDIRLNDMPSFTVNRRVYSEGGGGGYSSSPMPAWLSFMKASNVTETAIRHMVTFNRMVVADGIVMSTTALSNAAALLNNATAPLLVPKGASHGDWYKTPKFIAIQ